MKVKPEPWQPPIESEPASVPLPVVWPGGRLYNPKGKKTPEDFKEALDQALNAFSFYSIHISNRALWSE